MTHDDGRLQDWERDAIAWYLKGKGTGKGDGNLYGWMKGDGPASSGKGESHGPTSSPHSMGEKGAGKGKKGPPQEMPVGARTASVARPPEPAVPPGGKAAAAPKAARSKESTPAGIRPKARPDGGLPGLDGQSLHSFQFLTCAFF